MCVYSILESRIPLSKILLRDTKKIENKWKKNINIYHSIYIEWSRPSWFQHWEPDISEVAHIGPKSELKSGPSLTQTFLGRVLTTFPLHLALCCLIHPNAYFHHSNKMVLAKVQQWPPRHFISGPVSAWLWSDLLQQHLAIPITKFPRQWIPAFLLPLTFFSIVYWLIFLHQAFKMLKVGNVHSFLSLHKQSPPYIGLQLALVSH